MILIITVITIIIMIIIIMMMMMMIKWRNTCRALTAPNTELSVTYNSPKAANITKISTSDAAWVLYVPLKRLIHHLTWWIGVEHATWIPCLELSPIWFLKNTHNCNINKHNCNNSRNVKKKKRRKNMEKNNNNNKNNKKTDTKKTWWETPLSHYYKWQTYNLFSIFKTLHRHLFR